MSETLEPGVTDGTRLAAATADINNLLDSAELGILILSDDSRIRQYSQGMSSYFDLSVSDVGRPISAVPSKLTNGSLTNVTDDIARVRDVGSEHVREVRLSDGGWARSRVRPYLDSNNSVRGAVVTFLDISQTKRLDSKVQQQGERLEGLMDGDAVGYWDWNISEDRVYLSPAFKTLFGYADDEMENSLQAWQRIIHPDDLQPVLDMFDSHVASRGELPCDREVRYIHKNGAVVWVLCRGRIVEWDADHSPLRMMGMHLDITKLKKREQEIQRRAEEIRRFAFIAAHDLIQPINTFENSLSMLVEDLPESTSPDHDRLVHFLSVSAKRMKSRISGILEYSRLQEGTLELQRVDMNDVVKGVLADISATVEQSAATIDVKALPACRGSASLLARVFQNLLSNALKYTHPDRPCAVTIEEAAAGEGMVGYAVIDNGIGVPAKYREKIFELFSRLHTEREFEGNGLGLSLCERIVTRHEGHIRVEDAPQTGARFVFTLQAAE